MEKRFWLGVILLIVLLAAGLAAGFVMTACHAPGEELLLRARDAALNGEMDKAADLAEKARENWEKYWYLTASAADHSPMDDVDCLFAEMQVYAKSGESPHFAACCAQLAELLRAMYDAHTLTLWNLL